MKTVYACFIGPSESGKTALIQKYLHNRDIMSHEATIEDVYNSSIKREEFSVEARIVESGGDAEFKLLRDFHLLKAQFIIYVISVTDIVGFNNAYHEIMECITIIQKNGNTDLPKFIIVANKIDLTEKRVVSQSDLTQLQMSLNGICESTILETSALTSHNLKTLFMMLTVPKRSKSLTIKRPIEVHLNTSAANVCRSLESKQCVEGTKENNFSKVLSFLSPRRSFEKH